MNLYSSERGKILLIPADRNETSGPFLAGAENFEFRDSQLDVFVQEYNKDKVRLTHCILNVQTSTKLDLVHENFALMIRFGLKNALRLKTKNRPPYQLKTHEAVFLNAAHQKSTLDPFVSKEIRFIDALYAGELISEMKEIFPELSEIVENSNAAIFKKVVSLNFRIKDILNQILHCPYAENMRRYFFELKVRELLFELLNETISSSDPVQFSKEEVSAIMKARTLITSDLARHYHISDIAKKVNLNQQKLKLGFKQIFGKGVFELLKEHRLEEGRYLLQFTNMPVKQIASECGYARITGFITAFRIYFGLTPSEYRRKK